MQVSEEKFDKLAEAVSDLREEVRVGFATLPSNFVTKAEVDSAKKEALYAKRWAITTAVAVSAIALANLPLF